MAGQEPIKLRDNLLQSVILAIEDVFGNSGREKPHLDSGTPIGPTLGLDSLDWAEVVVHLHDRLGYDPFESLGGGSLQLETVGDLVNLYQQAAAQSR